MFWMNLHFSEDDSRGDDDYCCGHNPTGKECGLQGRQPVCEVCPLRSKSLASLLAAPTLDYNALQNCTRIVRHVGGGQEVANTEIPSCSKVAGGELRSS